MTTAIIVIILLIICVIGIRSYAKKLTQGCCGADGDKTEKVKVTDKNPENYPYSVKLTVNGMMCKHCKENVENALNSLDGIWADADFKSGLTLVRMKNNTDISELKKAVIKAGYTVTETVE